MDDGTVAPAQRRWRIAVCLSHPIQYKVPLLRRLASQPEVARLKAFFYSDTGLVGRSDAYHGHTVRWDVPLLDGYEYEFLRDWKFRKFRFFTPTLFLRLLQEPWDGVIIHSYLYPSDWLAWVVGRAKNIPILFQGEMFPRNYSSPAKRVLASLTKKAMLRGRTICLAIGSVAAQVYRDLGVPEERIFLAPYAVNNDFFMNQAAVWRSRKAELKAQLGVPFDVPVVLCVAGMVPKKRQVDLVEAMARMRVPARLVLVGHGPLLEEVRSYCQRRLPDTILAGFKNQTELPPYYSLADIFVLPSLWDEFGLVVNEAMCFGLPVIASNTVAASRDLVRPGENGYVFPPGDVDALEACLRLLLEDAGARQRYGQRSFEIISNWNYDLTIQGIFDALRYAHEKIDKT